MALSFLVTGAAGFIASHLCKELVKFVKMRYEGRPCIIVGIDKESYCSSRHNLSDIICDPSFVYYKADITKIEDMEHLFKLFRFNYVCHLAAETHVDNSFGNSLHFTESNVYGTHVLLEVAKKYGVERFLHMSTDEVYGDNDTMSSETSSLEPTNPYAATKVAAEYLVKSYHRSFKFPAIIVRGNNIYGPGQFPEKMIPRFILRLLANKKCTIHGNGSQRRSWLYVQDAVEAIVQVLEHGEIGHIYNIGTDAECDVLSIAKTLIRYIKPLFPVEDSLTYVEDRCFNDKRYLIDSSKLYATTKWRPKVTLIEGLKKTIDWYSLINPNEWWDETEIANALK